MRRQVVAAFCLLGLPAVVGAVDRPGIGGLYHSQSRGEVFLFQPRLNVMFFQHSRGPSEFYVRCPQK